MAERLAVAHLRASEWERIGGLIARSGVSRSTLVRAAIDVGLGRTGAAVTPCAYDDLIAALSSVGQSVNDAAHMANSAAARYSGPTRLAADDVDDLCNRIMAAARAGAAALARVDEVRNECELLSHATIVRLPAAPGTRAERLGARVSELEYAALAEAAGAAGISRSQWLRDMMMLIWDAWPEPPTGEVAIERPIDERRLAIATRRWDTNAEQCSRALERVTRARGRDRDIDPVTRGALAEAARSCSDDLRLACLRMHAVVDPVGGGR